MTYYRVEFTANSNDAQRAKKFRTKGTAEKYAKRVLGLLDGTGLDSKAAIVAVSKNEITSE